MHARKRVEDINRSATEEKTLGYRTSSALDYIFKDKDLAYILEALTHLGEYKLKKKKKMKGAYSV